MSDWAFLNQHRVRVGPFASSEAHGFNGAFFFAMPGQARRISVIASNGLGWEHVSVTFVGSVRTPSWEVMCFVRSLFWKDDEWVVQFHPPASCHVNNHPGCLHLWRPTEQVLPTPPAAMVGIKELGVIAR